MSINNLQILFTAYCDAPKDFQLGLPAPATQVMESIIHFHNILMFYIVFIFCFILYMLLIIMYNFTYGTNNQNRARFASNYKMSLFSHNSTLEIVWTIIPAFILLFIAGPSFTLLYSLDALIDPSLTLKIIGHQWYWTYEYSDFAQKYGKGKSIIFDSYIIPQDEDSCVFRLLAVDNCVAMPIKTHIRLLVTSADVLHSWAIPSFGIKIDACPGRLTQGSLIIKRTGIFTGQCSEICGINHGFMPISVQAMTPEQFIEVIKYNYSTQD